MSRIREPSERPSPRAQAADERVQDLIKDIGKDGNRTAELARVDVRELSTDTQQQLAQLLARELKGQLPGHLRTALLSGQAGTDLLQNLSDRLANTAGDRQRYGEASTPESARAQASDTSVPQQALRWTQFVQRSQHVPGAQLHDRAGSAAPKGEGTTLIELIAGRAPSFGGPGLRSPKLVERGLENLSPQQRDLLLRACVGEQLSGRLRELGIQDPIMLVKAGALPEGRAQLAEALGMGRGELLTLLFRTELLKIGPGKNGELGMRPDLLGPLKDAGIAMLGTLAAMRGLQATEMSLVYTLLRRKAAGFKKTMKGSRPPVKRDLIHWARQAARRPSEIMLADLDGRHGRLSRGDAQELICAWYLENLLWDVLLNKSRLAEELQKRRNERDDGDGDGDPDQDTGDEDVELEYDEERTDQLMCFWITDHNTNPMLPLASRRMYVCIDPDTGAILPQQLEAELASGKSR
jgi:hypothetical protein